MSISLSKPKNVFLDASSFKEQFQNCLDYCEHSSDKLKMAYGNESSFSKKVFKWVDAKQALEEIKKNNDRLSASGNKKNKDKVDLVKERKLEKEISGLKGVVVPLIENYVSQIYDLYMNSVLTHLPCILLGDESLRNSEFELRNFGVLSYGQTAVSKRLIPHLPTIMYGSILNDGSWSILKNDAFILGAIHGRKTVYITSIGYSSKDELIEKVFWENSLNRPALPGRELAMLYYAGYRQVATEELASKYGYTFVCLESKEKDEVKLMDLFLAAEKISNIDQIKAMFEYFPDEDKGAEAL